MEGIRPHDQLSKTTPLGAHLRMLWYDDYRPGETQALTVERGSTARDVVLTAQQHPLPFTQTAETLIALQLASYIIFIAVGTWLVLVRPARFTWGFFVCCLGLAAAPPMIGWAVSGLNSVLGLVAFCTWIVINDVATIGFLVFALRYPSDELVGWRAQVARFLPLLLAGMIALDAWSVRAWYTGDALPAWATWASDAAGFSACIVGVLSLVMTYRSATPRDRQRLLWSIIGSCVGFIGWFMSIAFANQGWFIASRISGFAMLAIPLSVGYAVIKHRVVDVRFALNRALTFSIIASCLVGILALTYWGTASVLQQSHAQLIVQIAIAMLVGVALQRIYGRVERWLRHALFRGHERAEAALDAAAGILAVATSFDRLDALLAVEPAEALQLEYAGVYRSGPDGGFRRVASAGSSASLPDRISADDSSTVRLHAQSFFIEEAGVPFAILVCGPHRSGTVLDPDEIKMMRRFSDAGARAYRGLAMRSQQTKRLAELLQSAPQVEHDGLADFLTDQVMNSLAADDRAIVVACATVPDATGDEIAEAIGSGSVSNRVTELLATTPFIVRGDEGYRAHRMLESVLRRRLPDGGRDALTRCAARASREGDHIRAARRYMQAGDRVQAFVSLETFMSNSGLEHPDVTDDLYALVESATTAELKRYPNLLAARVFRLCLVAENPSVRNESLAVWQVPLEIDRDGHDRLTASLAFAVCESGEPERAQRMLDNRKGALGSAVRAIIEGKRGGTRACEALALQTAMEADASSVAERIALLARSQYVDRLSGRWPESRLLAERIGAGHGPWSTLSLVEQLITAWTADDASCRALAHSLLEELSGPAKDSLAHLAENAGGGTRSPATTCYPKYAAYSWLMRACNEIDDADAIRCAERAAESAAIAREPYLQVLTLACLSELDAERRFAHLASAVATARETEADALTSSIMSLVADDIDAGMLAPVIARMRRRSASGAPPITVEVASGTVRRGREPVALSEGETALAIALARSPRPSASGELVEMLWPDLDEANGARALQTCVYRLRSKIGDPNAVESVAQGYRLRRGTTVDVWEADRLLAELPASSAPDEFQRARLESIVRRLGSARRMSNFAWEWYAEVERRVADLLRLARQRLADDDLKRGRAQRALEIARDMIAADEFDESARELAIRAHLLIGDVAEGRREFRRYRDLLLRELSTEPAASLAALLKIEDSPEP
ncbi:MAG TPA: BTAD domain-containing putative transcriptional regulator [Candidatus Eremiobacteraceae bacterium]|nr:BTAD domain-containing putative transcriptional regulator [Candidatus Eremiobacteraceae bacterium]